MEDEGFFLNKKIIRTLILQEVHIININAGSSFV